MKTNELVKQNALAIAKKYPKHEIWNRGKLQGGKVIFSAFVTPRKEGTCMTSVVRGRIKHEFVMG